MSDTVSVDVLTQSLTDRLESMPIAEASISGITSKQQEDVASQAVQLAIFGNLFQTLSDLAGQFLTKEMVLNALSKAIDAMLLSRPILGRIVGPSLKALILEQAGRLYDEFFARTEV